MAQMSEAQAADMLRKVVAMQAQGRSWAHIAVVTGYDNGQAAKKAAKAAALITQNKLLRETTLDPS